MIHRQDIQTLAALRGYPCLTITLPTHRTAPANRQDAIRLKNLVAEATSRLTGELGKREVADVLQSLELLATSIEHQHNLDGLALFVSADAAYAHRLPFRLPERVVVDEGFFIRDLVYAMNRAPRYWVLALSEQATRLFDGSGDYLEEFTVGSPFPMSYGTGRGEGIVPREPAINTSQLRDDFLRNFYRNVDQAFGTYMAGDPLPLALVGVDRAQSFFREVTRHGDYIRGTLNGNHERTPAHELGRLLWPLVQAGLANRNAAILSELNTAVGGQRTASTLGEVWRKAQLGRGATLIVEKGYHEAAALDETGLRLLPASEGNGPNLLDDAVDEVIEVVLAKGGRVFFVDDGTLQMHSRIALILRY